MFQTSRSEHCPVFNQKVLMRHEDSCRFIDKGLNHAWTLIEIGANDSSAVGGSSGIGSSAGISSIAGASSSWCHIVPLFLNSVDHSHESGRRVNCVSCLPFFRGF